MSVTIIVKTAKEKFDYSIEKDFVTIGRSNTNDIPIEDSSVSRKHSVFEREGDSFFITDLNSSNGTYINGKKLTEKSLVRMTDTIIIGRVNFSFMITEGEEESTMKITKEEMGELRNAGTAGINMPTPPSPPSPVSAPPFPQSHTAPPMPRSQNVMQSGAKTNPIPDIGDIPLSKPGIPQTGPLPPRAPQINTGVMEPAGFWIRAVAYILDGIILGIPLMLLMTIMSFISVKVLPTSSTTLFYIFLLFENIVLIGLSIGYSVYFWVNYCATPGKMILKLKVLDASTMRNMSYGKAIIRLLGYMLSGIFFIGFILIAFSDKKKGLHDMIAGTVVVKK